MVEKFLVWTLIQKHFFQLYWEYIKRHKLGRLYRHRNKFGEKDLVCLFCGKVYGLFKGFPGGSDGKESACKTGDPGLICGLKNFLEKWMATLPTPVFLPKELRGQRSLAFYSLWSHKESDMTELLTHTYGLFIHQMFIENLLCAKHIKVLVSANMTVNKTNGVTVTEMESIRQ